MALRSALPSDAAAIATLHAASWRLTLRGILSDQYLAQEVVAERMAVWEGQLRNPSPQQLVLVAHDDDEALLGFACTRMHDDPTWGARLENIHVSARAHRKGVGSQLLSAVAGRCAKPAAGERPVSLGAAGQSGSAEVLSRAGRKERRYGDVGCARRNGGAAVQVCVGGKRAASRIVNIGR